jgi:dihydrofolate reductase
VNVSIVIAVADNGVIGRDGRLPWQLPDDLAHFKRLTLGKPILMGRRTFESIGRALPGRRNLVLARAETAQMRSAGVEWVPDFASALQRCGAEGELCVIGGAAVYAAALPQARRIHLTRVHARPEGDVRLPPLAAAEWRETARVEHAADARHAHAMSFVTLERIRNAGPGP